jgi:N-acetylmuramoyl-L-alanine amidase
MKIITIRKEQILIVIYLLIISIGLMFTFRNRSVETFAMPLAKKTILIDPGHGGWDPGMVSKTNALEKDINLQISLKLQQYLEQGGSYVLTTRAIDESLGDTKMSDMNGRRSIANNENADIMISIHQNSYPKENVKGAQIFYYNESNNSKLLAESIQNQIVSFVDSSKNRIAKPNSNYYILKKTTIPSVIVECGFMTNSTDLTNLQDDTYQSKVAWAIYMGIIDYFNTLEEV